MGAGQADDGSKFALTFQSGLAVGIGGGYALAAGRWLKNDEPLSLTLRPAEDNRDRNLYYLQIATILCILHNIYSLVRFSVQKSLIRFKVLKNIWYLKVCQAFFCFTNRGEN